MHCPIHGQVTVESHFSKDLEGLMDRGEIVNKNDIEKITVNVYDDDQEIITTLYYLFTKEAFLENEMKVLYEIRTDSEDAYFTKLI